MAAPQTPDAAIVMARKQVPVLCYHQIREWRVSDKTKDKDYIIPPATFRLHIKMLADSGYHTILPDELYSYLCAGAPLPARPILLTFDDTDGDQYDVARPELSKYSFKGVFFIVTTAISKNRHYMSKAQIKTLSDEGNVIACHTRDHISFNKIKGSNWDSQVDQPTKQLEAITGKPIKYFAFPYGSWSRSGLPELAKHGFLAAFQLDQPRDVKEPLMTIRRVIDCGYWTTATLNYHIKHDFGKPVVNRASQSLAGD